jgi:hypothetical protein
MKVMLGAAAWLLLTGPASAQWITSKNDNPFEKTPPQWTFTMAAPAYAFGVACQGSDIDDVRLIFVTTEKVTQADMVAVNMLKPKLSVIVDDGERIDFNAEADVFQNGDVERLRLTVRGDQAYDFAFKIGSAKRRVSVATELNGQTFHATNFGVSGSKKQIADAIKVCGVTKPAS